MRAFTACIQQAFTILCFMSFTARNIFHSLAVTCPSCSPVSHTQFSGHWTLLICHQKSLKSSTLVGWLPNFTSWKQSHAQFRSTQTLKQHPSITQYVHPILSNKASHLQNAFPCSCLTSRHPSCKSCPTLTDLESERVLWCCESVSINSQGRIS
jgi:hypothetical protein